MLGRHTSSSVKLLLLCLTALSSRADAQSADPGWLQTRDQNPFVLATGMPLAPAMPDAGTWQVDTTFSIANTEMGLERNQASVLIDAETRETRLSVTYAFRENWSLRGSLAHFHVGAGALDGPVEDFHRLFGLSNGDRGQLGTLAPVVEVRLALHRASLVRAIMMAVANGDPEAAQVVAAECVLLADMKKHLDWDLVRDAVSQAGMQFCSGPEARQEMDDGCCPLDCTRGWCREQWMSSLDFPAVVPSPREQAERAGVAGTPSTRVSRTSE